MTKSLERTASYGVRQKARGKNLRLRLMLLSLYLALFVGYCVLFLSVVKMPQLIALFPILLLIIVPPTWRPLSCEREYSVECGFFIVENLYSFSKRKELARVEIRSAKEIAPYTPDAVRGARVQDYRGDTHSPDSYYVLYEKNGRRYALLFEGTQKLVRALRRHNGATAVLDTLRH